MKNTTTILFAILISISGFLNAQDLRYHLICVQDTVVLGDEAKLSLTISGVDKLLLDKKDSRIVDKETTTNYNFYVKPETIGKHEFGPYRLKINKKKLTSNKVSIVVVKPEEFVNTATIEIPDTVKVNSKARLILMSTHEKLELKLKENEFCRVVSSSISSSMSIQNGKARSKYRQIFEIEFIKRGELLITTDLFENNTSGVVIPTKKVLIVN